MTRLCMPEKNRITNTTDDSANNGCRSKDSNNETTDVFGSVNQYHAPMEIAIAAVTSTTEKRKDDNDMSLRRVTYFSIVVLKVEGMQSLLSIVFQRLWDLTKRRENLWNLKYLTWMPYLPSHAVVSSDIFAIFKLFPKVFWPFFQKICCILQKGFFGFSNAVFTL